MLAHLVLISQLLVAQPSQQEAFDLHCDNVVSMELWELPAEPYHFETEDKFFYLLGVELTPAAAVRFVQYRDAQPKQRVLIDGRYFLKEMLTFTANGKPLRYDVPEKAGYSDQGPNFPILKEEDAKEAAWRICKEKAPVEMKTVP